MTEFASIRDACAWWDSEGGDKLDVLNLWFCISDGKRILRTNAFGPRAMGYPKGHILGCNFWMFLHSDSVKPTAAVIRNYQSHLHFSNRWRCADGSYARWRWSQEVVTTLAGKEAHIGRAKLDSYWLERPCPKCGNTTIGIKHVRPKEPYHFLCDLKGGCAHAWDEDATTCRHA